MAAARERHSVKDDLPLWKLLYEVCFKPGWAYKNETIYMHKHNIEYREWKNKAKIPRGFITKLHTLALNNFRKTFKWIKFRGTKKQLKELKLLRPDGTVTFDPDIHIVDIDGKRSNSKKKTYSVDSRYDYTLQLINC